MDTSLRADVIRAQTRDIHIEGVRDRFEYLVAGAAGTSLDGADHGVGHMGGRRKCGLGVPVCGGRRRSACRSPAGCRKTPTDRTCAMTLWNLIPLLSGDRGEFCERLDHPVGSRVHLVVSAP